jgi:hypothetical protein
MYLSSRVKAKLMLGITLSSGKRLRPRARSKSSWLVLPRMFVSHTHNWPDISITREHSLTALRRYDLLRSLTARKWLQRLGQCRSVRHHDRVHSRRVQRPYGQCRRPACQSVQHRVRSYERLEAHSGHPRSSALPRAVLPSLRQAGSTTRCCSFERNTSTIGGRAACAWIVKTDGRLDFG